MIQPNQMFRWVRRAKSNWTNEMINCESHNTICYLLLFWVVINTVSLTMIRSLILNDIIFSCWSSIFVNLWRVETSNDHITWYLKKTEKAQWSINTIYRWSCSLLQIAYSGSCSSYTFDAFSIYCSNNGFCSMLMKRYSK